MALDPQIALGVQIPTPQNPIQTLTQIENVKALAEQRQALAQERMQQAQALVQKAKDTAAINSALQQTNGDYDAAGDLLTKGGNGSLAQGLYKQASDRRKGIADALDAQSKATGAQLDIAGKIISTMDTPEHYQAGLQYLHGAIQDPNLKQLIEKVAPPDATPDQIPGIVQTLSQMQVSAAERMRQRDEFVKGFLGGEYERNLAGELALTPPEQRQGVLQAALALAPDTQTRSALQTKFTPLLTAAPDVLNQMAMTAEQRTQAANQAQTRKDVEAGQSETARHNRAMEARPVAGALTGQQTSDVSEAVKGMADHTIPPQLPGRASKEYTALMAEAHRQGVDLAKLNEDWTATQKYLGTLNGAQQTRLRQAISFTRDSIPNIRNLVNQWDSSGLPVLSKANLEAAASGAQGNAAQSLAVRLKGQIADLTSELGTVYKGGNSSTDESLKLAGENLQANWSKKAALDALDQIEQNISIRAGSMRFGRPAGVDDNPYDPLGASGGRSGGAGAGDKFTHQPVPGHPGVFASSKDGGKTWKVDGGG